MNFAGRRALVTGGARGIGLAIAERLEREGCAVATLDLDPGVGERPHYLADLAEIAQIDALVSRIEQECGPIDILINCAASQSSAPFLTFDPEHFERVLRINLEAPVFLAQSVARGMAERGYGRIVNIGSIHGSRGAAGRLAYDISKAGLAAMSRTLGIELASSGVLINTVAPGFVDTAAADLTTDRFKTVYQGYRKLPMARAAQPEEIATYVVWLAGSENTYVTGASLAVDGGLSATF